MYAHPFKNYHIRVSSQDKKHCTCLPHGVPLTWHTERLTHDSGSLTTEPQFDFSSVRLKFKTDTSINLVSRMETTHNHSWVVVYHFNEVIKLPYLYHINTFT